MDTLSDEDKKRVHGILKSVFDGVLDKVKVIERLSESLENQMSIINPKVIDHLKNKCSNEFAWLEKNGKMSEKNGEIGLEIIDEAKPEAEKFFQKWEACTSSNDFGLKKHFLDIEDKTAKLQKDNEACINSCLKSMNVEDKILFSCFSSCINNFFDSSKVIMESSLGHIRSIDSKL